MSLSENTTSKNYFIKIYIYQQVSNFDPNSEQFGVEQVIYQITKVQNFTNNMSLPVNALKYIRLFPLFYSLVKINKYIHQNTMFQN